MNRKKAVYPLVIAIYVIIIVPVVFFRYQQIKKSILDRLNRTLFTAASNVHFFLDDEFHDTWNPENPLPDPEYQELKTMLNRYASLFEVEYVYTMVRRGGRVYFVVSNETQRDIQRGTPSLFYNPYPEPPEDLLRAFDSEEIVYYSSYTNIWDSFYSIFIPKKTPSGLTYVVAADVRMEKHREQLNESTSQLIGMVAFLLVPFIPFLIILGVQARNREDNLLNQLYTDSLTGLPNRKRFILDKSGPIGENTSAIMLDIDSFREINNLFGGRVGDLVLAYTAGLIRQHCAPGDLLYKFPADEFVLLLKNRSREEVLEKTKEILHGFQSGSFVTKGQSLNLTISAGVVYRPESQRRLLSSANIAKNRAKKDGKGFVLYDDSMDLEEHYSRNYFWLNQLKEALKEDRIVPFYQPIYNNRNNRIEKFEALVRLIDSQGSVISPDNFLAVAKRSKLYKQITHVMVEQSLRDFRDKPFTVSINLTVQDLLDGETVDFIIRSVERFGMKQRVVFELLESESLMEMTNFKTILNRLRSRGIGIAIDDFGSGYSNFGYLSNVPMDYLKIDGFIIRSLLKEKSSEAVVTAISAFSRDLGIPLIAEFVPCAETLSKLRELGVEYSQGFYIGKPAPFEKIQIRAAFLSDEGENKR